MIRAELLCADESELVEHYPNRRERFADGWVHGIGLLATAIGGVLLAAFSWAREVPEAISKATASAKKKMLRVPLKEGRTLHHDGNGHFGAGRVTDILA